MTFHEWWESDENFHYRSLSPEVKEVAESAWNFVLSAAIEFEVDQIYQAVTEAWHAGADNGIKSIPSVEPWEPPDTGDLEQYIKDRNRRKRETVAKRLAYALGLTITDTNTERDHQS